MNWRRIGGVIPVEWLVLLVKGADRTGVRNILILTESGFGQGVWDEQCKKKNSKKYEKIQGHRLDELESDVLIWEELM